MRNESGQKRREPSIEETREPSTPITPRALSDYPSSSRATPDLPSPATPRAKSFTASGPQPAVIDSATLERLVDLISIRLSTQIAGLSEKVESI